MSHDDINGSWLGVIKPFTIRPDGSVEVTGAEDEANYSTFINREENNWLKEEMRERIRRQLATPSVVAPVEPNVSAVPSNAMRMSAALERFAISLEVNGENSARTLRDKRRLLENLSLHMAKDDPSLSADPFVHEFTTPRLSKFLDAAPVNGPRSDAEPTAPVKKPSPKTTLKKISDLRSFFAYAHSELQATLTDPTEGLEKRSKTLRSASSKQDWHYEPFQTEHLTRIFEPKSYLAFNRSADFFWAPLLGLHLGTRLKEIVTLRLDAIGKHEPTGIWYIDVVPEESKNENSIRRLPLPDRLVELGFIDYVEHVRKLGAKRLFPHRDLDGHVTRHDPSKNCSRHFGSFLDSLELSERGLVFHSFRHTVVTALQDSGTPISDSMQLVGHQAQDYAMRTGQLTTQQSRSVHLDNYAHPDKSRLGVEHAIARLKTHLDRSIQVPLDYQRLKLAADVVREHTKQSGSKFKSGYSRLGEYAKAQLDRLEPGSPALVVSQGADLPRSV